MIDHRKPGRLAMYLTLLVTLALASASASAACLQSNLKGIWYSLGVSGDTFTGDFDETDYCKIKVNSSGKIVGSASSCIFRESAGKISGNITGGFLNITSACAVTGKINICSEGDCTSAKVEFGKMDRGKTVVSMLGYVTSDPDVLFSFTAIKQ